MSAVTKDLTRDERLALIPLDATYVQVMTEKGHEKYRPIDPVNKDFEKVLDTDEIVLKNGRPTIMTKKPGRKKKSAPPKLPTASTAKNAQTQQEKQNFFDHDALLNQIEKGVESEDILLLVMRGFAQEAASLEFERLNAEAAGKETSQLSIRRINALKAIGETYLKRKDQLAGKTIDMESPAFSRLFGFMLETFREAMLAGGVSRDHVETIFARLSDRMSDETWEQEARNKMKGE